MAQSKSDVPIFLQYPNMDLDENIVYDIKTPKHFGGKSLTISVDVKNKKLKFFIKDKLVGEV